MTYGARAAQAKGLKTVDAVGRQVVSAYVPANKNSSRPVRTQPNTYSSPVRTQTNTYSSALSQADQAKERNKVWEFNNQNITPANGCWLFYIRFAGITLGPSTFQLTNMETLTILQLADGHLSGVHSSNHFKHQAFVHFFVFILLQFCHMNLYFLVLQNATNL